MARPSTDDLKQSRFLKQCDVDPPILVTISGHEEVNVALEGIDMQRILHFKEAEKPLVLKPVNGQIIEDFIGSKYYDDWVGRQIVLYKDSTVSYGTKITGGIRARAPKNQTAPMPEPKITNPDYVGDDPPPPTEDDVPF